MVFRADFGDISGIVRKPFEIPFKNPLQKLKQKTKKNYRNRKHQTSRRHFKNAQIKKDPHKISSHQLNYTKDNLKYIA